MQGHRRYFVNDKFFDIWSPSMAYILGFITADGSMHKYTLSTKIQARDIQVLEFIRGHVSPQSPIKMTKNRNKEYCKVSINSKFLSQSLIKYNIIPNKSLVIRANFEIPEQFFGAYLRGVFDGDGWAYNRRNIVESAICSGSYDFLVDLRNRLPIGRISSHKKKKNTLWTWDFNYHDSLKLRDLMYSDGGFCLERKKQRLYFERKPRSSKFWRPEEIQFLKENYRTATIGNLDFLSNSLGRSRKSISKKIWELNR